MTTQTTITFRIPDGEWSVADFCHDMQDSEVLDIDAAVWSALMDAPNRSGWQVGECNGWRATIRGMGVTVRKAS